MISAADVTVPAAGSLRDVSRERVPLNPAPRPQCKTFETSMPTTVRKSTVYGSIDQILQSLLLSRHRLWAKVAL
jgi:hypothetical protein